MAHGPPHNVSGTTSGLRTIGWEPMVYTDDDANILNIYNIVSVCAHETHGLTPDGHTGQCRTTKIINKRIRIGSTVSEISGEDQ